MTKDKISKSFDAEVSKVLHLVIHSLYTKKEIFLRELISNASDALEKRRLRVLEMGGELDELKIIIKTNKEAGLLIIEDNGIGMNQEEMIANLGTIASSGTQKFLT
ncbi:MAG: ATP-binding protein, partial [Proteobacteria bacterium]|nr:ATP-binding protein [Pseudomonadota bacterium]